MLILLNLFGLVPRFGARFLDFKVECFELLVSAKELTRKRYIKSQTRGANKIIIISRKCEIDTNSNRNNIKIKTELILLRRA